MTPAGLEPVDAALDRRRAQRDARRRCPGTSAGRSHAAAQRSAGRSRPNPRDSALTRNESRVVTAPIRGIIKRNHDEERSMAPHTATTPGRRPPARRTSCRCTASTTSSCGSATPPRPPTSTSTPSASGRSPTPGSRPGGATATSHVLEQGRDPARADRHAARRHRGRPPPRAATATACAPSRCRSPTSTTPTPRRSPAARAASPSPPTLRDEHGRVRRATIADLRRHAAHVRRPRRLRRAVPARASRRDGRRAPRRRPAARDRPHRRQRRARPHGRVGRLLRATSSG